MHPRIRLLFVMSLFACLLIGVALTDAHAQQPGKKGEKKGGGGTETAESFVTKMMAFNKAKNGKLTKEELIDTRLHYLFERADTNKDGAVTREELEALFTREQAGDKGKGPKDGFGDKGKGDKGKGPKDGFGDKGKGKGGFPQPGVVLNPFMQDILNLTDAQRTQLADLQKDVDARLEKILTDDQRRQLRDMSAPKGFGDKKGPFGEKKGNPK